ncbi:MAG: GNAT family N-acetyltransferase [Chloroflexota bacterium]
MPSKIVTYNIRQAQASDLAAMQDIAARTWGGDDYLPQVLDRWIDDPTGKLFAAVDKDIQIRGMARIVQLGEDEWWLEGVRVDPDDYVQGIGLVLLLYCIREADKLGSGVLRMATVTNNIAIQDIAAKNDFTPVGSYALYRTDSANPQKANEFRQLTPNDIPAIRAFLDQSPYYEWAAHSMENAYQWRLITDARLYTLTADSLIYGWFPHTDKLEGIVIFNPLPNPAHGRVPILSIAYLDATVGNLASLALAVRGLLAEQGHRRARLCFVARPERLVAMEQAGWRWLKHIQLDLFSRPIQRTTQALSLQNTVAHVKAKCKRG